MKQNSKRWIVWIKKALVCPGLVLFLVAGVPTPSVFSQGGGRVKPEMVFPEYYPYGFHGMGQILRMTQEEVVIDDNVYALSTGVTYHTLEIEHASKAFFQPGKRVGYLFDSEGKIKSLWMIE